VSFNSRVEIPPRKEIAPARPANPLNRGHVSRARSNGFRAPATVSNSIIVSLYPTRKVSDIEHLGFFQAFLVTRIFSQLPLGTPFLQSALE
jgi:hypothetical protein